MIIYSAVIHNSRVAYVFPGTHARRHTLQRASCNYSSLCIIGSSLLGWDQVLRFVAKPYFWGNETRLEPFEDEVITVIFLFSHLSSLSFSTFTISFSPSSPSSSPLPAATTCKVVVDALSLGPPPRPSLDFQAIILPYTWSSPSPPAPPSSQSLHSPPLTPLLLLLPLPQAPTRLLPPPLPT